MRLPLGRGIGQRRALALHHITAGFVYSQVLAACVEIDLFAALQTGPKSTRSLSERTHLAQPGLERLLLAATALDLIENYGDGSWGLGELGAAMIANPGIGAMVTHHQHLYRDLLDPVGLLQSRQSTHLSRYWPYARNETEHGGHDDYSDLMAISQLMVAGHVIRAAKLTHSAHLTDVAGGSGAFARAVLAASPNTRATVLDLPEVASRAQAENHDQRLTFVGGDMFEANIAPDCDTVSLIRILHDHDDEPVMRLLRKLNQVMPANARLVIAEPMAETEGAAAIGDTYFGIYLWAMGSGRPRSRAVLTQMLSDAGFQGIRERRSDMPCLVRVIEAYPSKA